MAKRRYKRKRCPSGKYRYPNLESAEAELFYALMGYERTVPKRAYHCELCNAWHLTSKEKHS